MTLPPVTLPPVTLVRQYDTHRLIPAKYSAQGESVLVRIADNDDDLAAIFALDDATNVRLRAEGDLLPGIGIHELVFGIPYYRIVNAAFCHAHPLGSRFNGPDRGAWYAAFEIETAEAEIAYHKWLELSEIGWREEEIGYDDYLADFSAAFHDLRGAERRTFSDALDPDSYIAAQELAEQLLENEGLGIVYPSVRHRGGICIACFRPALVSNVRKGEGFVFRWSGEPQPTIALRAS